MNKKSGFLLLIVGVIILTLAIRTPKILNLFNGYVWQISVFIIGIFCIFAGILNIFYKKK